MSRTQVKLCLIGDGGVGKTTFVKKLANDKFNKKYIATLGVDVLPIDKDSITYNIWDCAGQEKFGGLKDGYYISSDVCICMFDLTSKSTFLHIEKWINEFQRVAPGKSILIVGNKSDMVGEIKVKSRHILAILEKLREQYPNVNFAYMDYSVKSCVGNLSKASTFHKSNSQPLEIVELIKN